MISLIRASIKIEVFGSSPEFGSSQNKYLGFIEIARAIPILFCIPPLHSEGNKLLRPDKFTRSKQKLTRASFSAFVILVNILKGNIIFSSTVIESNNAAP